MTQIKEDEEYFELINDFPSSDLAIVHDLTLAIMKIRGVYHPDYRGYRDACYLENFQEASRTFKKLKLNIKFPYYEQDYTRSED